MYQYPILPSGVKEPSALYNLNPAKVRYDKTFRTRLIFEKSEIDKAKQNQFKYEEDTQWQDFNIDEIIPFFDIANGLTDDFLLKAPSRLKSIQKNIININTALTSEKNALEKAGRFIVSGSTKGNLTPRPLENKEKRDIESNVNSYGNARAKGNVSVTNSNVEVHSLHIPMNQLGIPESIASNSMHIMGVFGVPRELYPLDKSGATFENQKQATINLIQNVVQNEVNDFCNSYNSFFTPPKPLTGTLDHLSAMQHVEDMKADKALKISAAIRNLQNSGINPDEFLETMGINMNQDG